MPRSLVVVAALVALPAWAAAQAPKIQPNPGSPGEWTIDFEVPPVLDYSYDGSGGPGTTLTVQQDLQGKISGHTVTTGVYIISAGVVTGKVKSRDGLAYVATTTVEEGTIGGDPTTTVSKLRGTLFGWGDESTLIGDITTKTCLTAEEPSGKRRRVCGSDVTPFTKPLPHAGDWQVIMNLEQFGAVVGGYGFIVTGAHDDATARIFEMDANGKIAARTGLVKLVLRPRPDQPSPGKVTLIGALAYDADGLPYLAAIHEVKGKLLGQAVDEVFPDAAP
jgi:hypothetical protein